MVRLGVLVFVLGLSACASTPRPIAARLPWPESHEADLDAELTVTAARDDAEPIPPVPDEPLVQARELELEGVPALVVILGRAREDDPLPTVWAIHGRGDQPRIPAGPFEDLSRPIRVVLPRAPLPLGEGFSWFPLRVADNRPDELAVAVREQAERLARAIDAHRALVPYRGRPIVAGFSQGGLLTFALALLHPDRVGTALPNAGWLPPALEAAIVDPSAYPPIRTMHGTADEAIPFPPTAALVERLAASGLDVELRTFEGVGHAMSEEMDAQFRAWLEAAIERAQ